MPIYMDEGEDVKSKQRLASLLRYSIGWVSFIVRSEFHLTDQIEWVDGTQHQNWTAKGNPTVDEYSYCLEQTKYQYNPKGFDQQSTVINDCHIHLKGSCLYFRYPLIRHGIV